MISRRDPLALLRSRQEFLAWLTGLIFLESGVLLRFFPSAGFFLLCAPRHLCCLFFFNPGDGVGEPGGFQLAASGGAVAFPFPGTGVACNIIHAALAQD